MKVIPLTQGKAALVDEEDYATLSVYRWQAKKQVRQNRTVWYAVRQVVCAPGKQRTQWMHWKILKLTDLKIKTDHKNGDTLDNRRENLRQATNRQNCRNQHKVPGRTSRYKGVHLHKTGKWVAQIKISGNRQHYLGIFEDEKDAAAAYDSKAKLEFGEFALLNSVVKAA